MTIGNAMCRRVLAWISAVAVLHGCAHQVSLDTVEDLASRERLGGKHLRLTLSQGAEPRAVTVQVMSVDYPFVEGPVVRDEVQVGGIWTDVSAQASSGRVERFNLHEAQRVDLLQRTGPALATGAITGSCLTLLGAMALCASSGSNVAR